MVPPCKGGPIRYKRSVGAPNTLRLGVKGSGRRMLRGKADRMRLRIWMQEGGIMLHSSKWYSHKNSGKSCSSTSSTRSVPCKITDSPSAHAPY